ncbi:hypothetical protein U27_05102 [Candidatus Vecturithrix granuli]|uniref:ABC transporter substrate binding protein n=1 Tax=Vecturithrix granuli TaxID=1499967 RepID=A0A081C0M4_VECG1|nr:hypothetical protein U27_05102 [Candidatus Vecturithrix granuli]
MKRIVWVSMAMVGLLWIFVNIGFTAELKKVIILSSRSAESMPEYVLKGLAEAGFEEQRNLTGMQMLVLGNTDPAQIVAQVKEAAPDVVVNTSEFGHVVAAVKELSLSIITVNGVERDVNPEGVPTANVTGIYSNLPDFVYNSYKFLQKVAPLKPGQQAVFLDIPEVALIPKADVVEALQRLEIPLKAVVDATIYEDWQQAVLQYNDDPEVGWILRGTGPMRKRDGSPVDIFTEMFPWEREHLKKPMVTYWETTVRDGALCGFGLDLDVLGEQAGRMAARVLRGEPIQSIKAEYPQKVSISLNRKTATNLGIVFSLDVLNLANVIYDDYEGKQVIRK